MANIWRIGILVLIFVAIVAGGISLINIGGNQLTATAALDVGQVDTTGYERAIAPYEWNFPEDYGAHEDFLTEWWYYTGNVATEDGRRFGYQFTVFRRALNPESFETDSEWRTNQIYFAHFTISDIADDEFYHTQRFSRDSAGLSGATTDPRYRVWVEDWQVQALNADASRVQLTASADEIAIDVTLEQTKPPALQGQDGLSPKRPTEGNASYYYTLSRLATDGTLTVNDETFVVSGNTWRDHEFSTNALGDGVQGWDWFGLIFDDNTELMIGQIRLKDGTLEPAFGGMMIYEDGSTEYLPSDSFRITATDTWRSPYNDVDYPAGWTIDLTTERGTLTLNVEPLMADQELHDFDPAYWEGAVRITGDKSGYGYAELTGYVSPMENRF